MRPLKSLNQSAGIFGSSLFFVLFGLGFIVAGLSALPFGRWSKGGGFDYYDDSPILAFFAIGIWFALGATRQANLARKLGEHEASISEPFLQPGQSFHFHYQQRCRQLTTIHSIAVFLVFRETVTYLQSVESKTRDIDRLIQYFTHPGRVYSANEVIQEEHVFQIPTRAMGLRNPFMNEKDATVQTMWVVKVCLDLGVGSKVWDEYEVEVNGKGTESRLSDTLQKHNTRFDVFLKSGWRFWSIMKAMSLLLPHLNDGQIGDLYFHKPTLLLEKVTEHEAQTAKAQLEASGARVEVRMSISE